MFPITASQKTIWFDQNLFPFAVAHHIIAYTRIYGEIDRLLFESAISILIAQNDVLRARFDDTTSASEVFNLEYLDFSTTEAPQSAACDWMKTHADLPLSGDNDQLYTFTLLKVTASEYCWYMKVHRSIADQRTISLLNEKLAGIYETLAQGNVMSPAPQFPFANYAAEQQHYLASAAFTADESYWKTQFQHLPQTIAVGVKMPHDAPLQDHYIKKTLDLDTPGYQQLQELTATTGVTIIELFLGALYTYFSRINRVTGLVIGTVIPSRFNPELEKILGPFTNLLPFKMDYTHELNFEALLMKIKTDFQLMASHQRFPAEALHQLLQTGESRTTDLFDISLTVENHREIRFNGFETETIILTNQHTPSALAVQVNEYASRVSIDFHFSPQHWTTFATTQFFQQFEIMMTTLLNKPQQQLIMAPLVTTEIKAKLLAELVVMDIPDATLTAQFEKAVAAYPDQLALEFAGKQFTYTMLNETVNILAHQLRDKFKVQPEQIVAHMVPKSELAIIAILGILKSGAAYLPIDPAYPEERKKYMLDNSGTNLLLTISGIAVPEFDGEILLLDQNNPTTENRTNPLQVNLPKHTCYVIYTSGSTGNPKGVVVKHISVVNTVLHFKDSLRVQSSDRCLLFAALSFDVSALDIFMALFSGALLLPASKETIADLDSFAAFIQHQKISILGLPPSYLRNLNKLALTNIRALITAGEAAIPRSELNLREDQEYYNGYGPTECAICPTIYLEKENINHNVPIGQPVRNMQAFILDQNLQLMPCGIPGEIYLSGIGLAKGYLNNPELTAEKFIPSPFAAGQRLYQTGDEGRWLSDGNIEYLGRKDDQVKIRGYRIEPGEIEVVLKAHHAVQNVAVVVKEEQAGNDKSLYAFVAVKEQISTANLNTYLAEQLPPYMVPDRLLLVADIPLTINGKVDRKALLSIAATQSDRLYVAPETPTERMIAQIWEVLLGVKNVGRTDSFFLLGGHSLKVGQFINRFFKQTGIKLRFREVFRAAVLKDIALLADGGQPSLLPQFNKIPEAEYYPLSPSQKGIWLSSQQKGQEHLYNIPLPFVLHGSVNLHILKTSFELLVANHEALRTSFTEIGGLPYQQVKPQMPVHMEVISFEDLSAEVHTQFNLNEGPLFRVVFTAINEEKSLLIFTLHHIISDGLTLQLLLDEWMQNYQLLLDGKTINRVPGFQYKDYANWLEKMIESPEGERQRTFWLNKLQHAIPFSLAQYTGRLPDNKKEAGIYTIYYAPELRNGIKLLAEQAGATVFMVLQAILKVVFFKLTGQQDIIIGTAISGREKEETEKIAGLLINTIALYDQIKEKDSFSTFLQQVKITSLEGLENQLFPFDRVVELVQPENNTLFDVMIAADDQQLQSNNPLFQTNDPVIDMLTSDTDAAKFNITFDFETRGENLGLQIVYDHSIFTEDFIILLARYFSNIAGQVIAHPENLIDQYQLAYGNEKELFNYLNVFGNGFESAYPITTSQRDIYLTSLLDPHGSGLRLLAYFNIPNAVDPDAWKAAIECVTRQETSLRSTLIIKDTEVFQGVRKTAESHFEFIDLSETLSSTTVLHELIKSYTDENQDLDKPYFKHYLFKLSENHFVTATSAHHIFSDGVSFKLLVEKIDAAYHHLKSGVPEVPATTTSFRNYVLNHLSKFDTQATESFWKARLINTQPLVYQGTISPTDQLFDDLLYISGEEAAQLQVYCKRHKVRPSVFFKSIFALLIRYYCNTDHDFCIRENLAGRTRQQADMIGSISHCFPLVVEEEALKQLQQFTDLCVYLKQQKTSANDFQWISLSLQNRIIGAEKLSFFYNYQHFSIPETQSEIGPLHQIYHLMENQLELRVAEMADAFELKLDYNSSIFNGKGFLSRIYQLFKQLIQEKPLAELEYLLPEELELLKTFGQNTSLPAGQNILELFATQTALHPEHPAVVFNDKTISYAALDRSSDHVAAHLQQLGAGAGTIVSILVSRSEWMLIAVLGVLKAGAAYLPIDPDYPQERIAYLLKDSQTKLVLTHAIQDEKIPEGTLVVALEQIPENVQWTRPVIQPEQLAYVIYTSGTTGNPKGVMVSHQALSNIAQAWRTAYHLDRFDVALLQMASFSFDVFTGDMVRALCHGGKLVICPAEMRLDVVSLYELITTNGINIFEATPALIIPLMDYIYAEQKDISCLKLLILGSDSCPVTHFKRLLERFSPAIRIINSYGVTEACIDSGFYENEADLLPLSGNTPIGKPLANYTYHVCNPSLQQVPVGIPGELLISGAGVAQGYLGRQDLTAAKFIINPYTGAKTYRTGDIVRWLPDGNLEFAGRKDHQVKIRGYRIELQEIESTILQQENIKETLVTVHGKDQEKELVCWYVSQHGGSLPLLKEKLKQLIPEYMVPAYFIQLEQLPLTPNGKVDRKTLPDPLHYIDQEERFTDGPETETEIRLLALWQDILKRKHIGITDSFFELGGHSLKATTAVARIFKTFQVNFPLSIFFNQPTIKEQADYIDQQQKESSDQLKPATEKAFYPLSSSQKRLFLLHQIEGAENSYNLPAAFHIKGNLDISKLENAFSTLIARHEILRTAFEMRDGEPVQLVKDIIPFHIEQVTVTEKEIKTTISSFIRLFDLSAPPLLRVEICHFEENRKLLLVDMHHIVSDGVSSNILVEELIRLYNGETLEPLHIQYKDFAVWQQQFLASSSLTTQEKYWLKQFADEVPLFNLQTDFPRPPHKSFNGKRQHITLPQAVADNLEQLSLRLGYTINQLLLATFKVLLYKYSGNEDLVVGTPVSGRTRTELDQVIGMFVNTLALRSYPSGNKLFGDFLAEVRQTSLEALQHQDYPFELLVDRLDIKRDLSRNPLFDIMFAFVHEERADFPLGDATLEAIDDIYDTSKFDLLMQGLKTGEGIELSLEYSTDLFTEAGIAQFLEHFVNLIRDIDLNIDRKLADINVLSSAEERLMLIELNDTAAGYPETATLHQLFETQVSKFPLRTALVWEDQEISYADLNTKANVLAANIRYHLPTVKNPIIAVLMDRGPEMVIALFAILKAGGAYLPIDPDYPQERIQYMLEDSAAAVLVSHTRISTVPDYTGVTVNIDQLDVTKTFVPVEVKPEDLAYIIYTSGSTGKPKGVMIEHRNVVRLLFNDKDLFDFTENDTWTLFHSYCFDFSVWEMYGALLFGGKLVIVPKSTAQSPKEFLKLLKDKQVTVLNQTPGSFYNVIAEELEHPASEMAIHYVIFGGEALKPGKLKSWRERYPDCRLINMYGITETTVHVTYKEITVKEITENTSNIGKPIPTLSLIVLDQDMKLVPMGVAGELCVGGAGLARGYLNRPELTEERFMPHPYIKGARLYRTGDMAKLLPGGDFEYLRRIDHQVKIRGFRIEIGEIESKLLLHPLVNDTLVMDRDGDSGAKHLCAYVVTDQELTAAVLRKHLTTFLPDYMVPSFFVMLPAFPLTGNGKIDRKRLPLPEETDLSAAAYEAPQTPTEERLAHLWTQLLNVPKVGRNDQFFDLGGHSLKAAQLVSLIHKHFQVEISIKSIFSTPDLAGLAVQVEEAATLLYRSIERVPEQANYPASSAVKRLFILNQIDNSGIAYNIPGFYAIEGELDVQRFSAALNELIRRHETLRSIFVLENKEVVQVIPDQVPFNLEIINHEQEDPEALMGQFIRPFDLAAGSLLRVNLVRVPSGKYYFLFDIHHIIADEVSVGNFVRELAALYSGQALPELSVQYKDYAVWQERWLKSTDAQLQKSFWKAQFEEPAEVLNMPSDYIRPQLKSYEGDIFSFSLDPKTAQGIRELSKQSGATHFMTMLTAYTVLLSKYSGQEDITIGTPVANRSHADLQDLIGMFVNTLPLRNFPEAHKGFMEYLLEVKEYTLKAIENQDYPFEALLDDLELNRDRSRNPLFDYMFTYQFQNIQELHISDLLLKACPFGQHSAKMDLSMGITETDTGEMYVTMEYATKLFSRETIDRIARHFNQILQQVIADPDIILLDIEMITAAEKQQILEVFNQPANQLLDTAEAMHIYTLFETNANRFPDRIAVTAGEISLTYRELQEQATSIAGILQAKGCKPGEIAGLYTDRSVAMIIGILGILKTGAAYLPIDPDYPQDRIRYMLEDSNALLLLSQQALASQLTFDITTVLMDALPEVLHDETTTPALSPTDVAYVIYTSGSTGKPKGVQIEHHSLYNFLFANKLVFKNQLSHEDVCSSVSSASFDASVLEIFIPLAVGAKLVLVSRENVYDVQALANILRAQQVTFCFVSPVLLQPLYQVLKDHPLPHLNKLDVGAEVVKESMLRAYASLNENMQIVNSYGPTEATIVSSCYSYEPGKINGPNVPIGKPLANLRIYLLNEQMHLQPIGVPGELCVSGTALARGYLNNPELTKEKFIDNPFEPGTRLYKTGDLAKWLPDGNIDFIGRKDHQVKIRGFRIELGEIENQLISHPQVEQALVIDKTDNSGNKFLCAYVLSSASMSATDLRMHLSAVLPEYMIPAFFIVLDKFPLTKSEKIDRRALPEPDLEHQRSAGTLVLPENDTEKKLLEIWKTVLKAEQLSVTDNFFEVGGNSLKIINMMRLIQETLGEALKINDLFDKPTIRAQAAVFPKQTEKTTPAPAKKARRVAF